MQLDPTITVGNLLSALAVIVTVVLAAWKISVQIKKLQWRVGMIWRWYKKEHNIEDSEDDL